jgi:hypothetical protein
MIVAQFPHFDTFPAELREKEDPKWVVCDPEKVPMVALLDAERLASSTNPDTWRSYPVALEAFRIGQYAGIGRVITPPYTGIDLDEIRNPQSGIISEWGWQVISYFDSYSEVSPSGDGVKIWVKGILPRGYVRPGLEVYPGGRYFTVTGQFLSQTRMSIEPRQDELDAFIAKEFPPRKKPKSQGGGTVDLELEEILERAGVEVRAEVHDNSARVKYRVLCPWIDEHTEAPETGSYVGQYDDGAMFYHCWHSHCSDRGWTEFLNSRLPKVGGMRRYVKTYESGKAVITLD